jgi:hypothetical protein
MKLAEVLLLQGRIEMLACRGEGDVVWDVV